MLSRQGECAITDYRFMYREDLVSRQPKFTGTLFLTVLGGKSAERLLKISQSQKLKVGKRPVEVTRDEKPLRLNRAAQNSRRGTVLWKAASFSSGYTNAYKFMDGGNPSFKGIVFVAFNFKLKELQWWFIDKLGASATVCQKRYVIPFKFIVANSLRILSLRPHHEASDGADCALTFRVWRLPKQFKVHEAVMMQRDSRDAFFDPNWDSPLSFVNSFIFRFKSRYDKIATSTFPDLLRTFKLYGLSYNKIYLYVYLYS
jgi:hypothetical protein